MRESTLTTLFFVSGILLLVSVAYVLTHLVFIQLFVYPFNKSVAIRLKQCFASIYYFMNHIIVEFICQKKMVFYGDTLPMQENVLMISNHVSFHDLFILFNVAARRNRLGQCRVFTKDEIRNYGPWGWSIRLLGFIFVKRDWTEDAQKIQYAFQELLDNPTIPIFLISFLDRRRLTPARQKNAREFAETVCV
jgi:1-acyl-sn-glycerol-3-phosphate acyltransferase